MRKHLTKIRIWLSVLYFLIEFISKEYGKYRSQ
jgi:hypothetical protein